MPSWYGILLLTVVILVTRTGCDEWDDAEQRRLLEDIVPELYSRYRRAWDSSHENTFTFRRILRNNKEYNVHINKLKDVNGYKRHNIIIKEQSDDNPLIYINNPVETKIPNAYLTIEGFRELLLGRVLRQREEFKQQHQKTFGTLKPVRYKTQINNKINFTQSGQSKPNSVKIAAAKLEKIEEVLANNNTTMKKYVSITEKHVKNYTKTELAYNNSKSTDPVEDTKEMNSVLDNSIVTYTPTTVSTKKLDKSSITNNFTIAYNILQIMNKETTIELKTADENSSTSNIVTTFTDDEFKQQHQKTFGTLKPVRYKTQINNNINFTQSVQSKPNTVKIAAAKLEKIEEVVAINNTTMKKYVPVTEKNVDNDTKDTAVYFNQTELAYGNSISTDPVEDTTEMNSVLDNSIVTNTPTTVSTIKLDENSITNNFTIEYNILQIESTIELKTADENNSTSNIVTTFTGDLSGSIAKESVTEDLFTTSEPTAQIISTEVSTTAKMLPTKHHILRTNVQEPVNSVENTAYIANISVIKETSLYASTDNTENYESKDIRNEILQETISEQSTTVETSSDVSTTEEYASKEPITEEESTTEESTTKLLTPKPKTTTKTKRTRLSRPLVYMGGR